MNKKIFPESRIVELSQLKKIFLTSLNINERLDVDGLKAIGIGPGPVYAKIKAGQDIIFNGEKAISKYNFQ